MGEISLLPCPFCGGSDIAVVDSCDFVACQDCGVTIEDGEPNSRAVWNTRARLAAKDEAEPVAWQVLVKNASHDRWCNLPEDWTKAECVDGYQYRHLYATPPTAAQDEARERVIEALPPCGYGLMPDPEVALTYASILLKPKRCVDGVRRGPGEIEKAAAMALQLYARRVANAEEREALSPSNPTRMQGGEEA